MRWPQNLVMVAARRREENPGSVGVDLNRKARIAFALYGVLAILAWFTLDGTVRVYGRPVELRLVPLMILGGLVLRTVVALQADRIRRQIGHEGEKGSS